MYPKKSLNVENMNIKKDSSDNRRKNNVGDDGISRELTEERIPANIQPVDELMWIITQFLNQLIDDNSSQITPIAVSCAHRPHTGTSPDETYINVPRLI